NALIASLAVLLVIGAAAYLLAKNFVAPITAMNAAARRFAKGERGIRLAEAHRDDEFGELATQFNAMVEESDRQEKIQQGIRRNIVHDLKTPVTVIKGMGETLTFPEMAEDPTWRDEMVRAIVEQSDRLLDDLKDILQPIDTNYRPDVEEFDLSLLIERVVKSEKHTSRAADHLLVIEGTEAPVMIQGDRRKLRRVYENLLSNAIKYSPGTGKRVIVSLQKREGDEVAISFQDEGLGMDAEQLRSVLGSGGRIESHAQMGIEGTGFGLDSVQTVLRAHGGTLEAISQPNQGSTFTAVLPIRITAATTKSPRQ
ncbi:HAMP domain-containing histidine kinase, partial [bacterium]